MPTFEFSVIASGLDPQDEHFETRFYDAGCDDATVSFQKGHTILDFAREAETITDAIASAVSAMQSAGATVDRIEPDPLVSLSDIAARSALTKAAISNYTHGKRGGGDFPAPVVRVTSESPLWDWAPVARWLYDHEQLSYETLIVAEAVTQANLVLRSGADDFAARFVEKMRRCDEQRAA